MAESKLNVNNIKVNNSKPTHKDVEERTAKKQGRPKKAKNDLTTERVTVLLTQEEKIKLENYSTDRGMSHSVIIRNLLIDSKIIRN